MTATVIAAAVVALPLCAIARILFRIRISVMAIALNTKAIAESQREVTT